MFSRKERTLFFCSPSPRPFILKLDQSQLRVDLECSHTTIAKDVERNIKEKHTHREKTIKK